MSVLVLTIGVDEWENVKVVVVQECLGEIVASFVAIDELFSDVLQDL
jgi:hypothetical protein